MIVCKMCEIEKELSDFPHSNRKPNSKYCHKCFYIKYRDTSMKCTKEYYKKNKEECAKKSKERREDNKEEIKESRKKYYEDNKEEILLKNSIYCKQNRDSRNKKARENYRKRLDNNRKLKRDYVNEKLRTNELFKLKCNIRCLIGNAFRRGFTTKSKKTIEILGCSFEEFKLHLESKFDDKMNWQNQGTYWHMDHIIPISSAQTEEDVYRLNHYTNFRPLYWEDNLKKSNKIEYEG